MGIPINCCWCCCWFHCSCMNIYWEVLPLAVDDRLTARLNATRDLSKKTSLVLCNFVERILVIPYLAVFPFRSCSKIIFLRVTLLTSVEVESTKRTKRRCVLTCNYFWFAVSWCFFSLVNAISNMFCFSSRF